MSHLDRRRLMGWAALLGLGAATGARAQPAALAPKDIKKDTDIAVLYHCDFGDPQRFSQLLGNINNHLGVYDFDPFKIKIVIVAHSAGIKFFLKDLEGTPWAKETLDPDIQKRIAALAKYGVDALLCQITFKRLNVDPAKLRDEPYIKTVVSGVATVAELQGKGFAYLKVG